MQNLSYVPTDNQPRIMGAVTPETAEALRTAKRAEWTLEAEYFCLDWQARCELADDLRDLTDDLSDELADVAARVAADLEDESEDFSAWETRSDAARRVRQIARVLEQGVTANA